MENMIKGYENYLEKEEKSKATVLKYVRDVTVFLIWENGRGMEKELVLEYKNILTEKYAPRSVNSVLSSLNSFFEYMGLYDCKVKTIKIQNQIFYDKCLTREEYIRLLNAAKGNDRLYNIIQTICSTGIRVSELKYITVEAVRERKAVINGKGKMRTVLLPAKLCKALREYIKKSNIKSGSVFVTRTGKPLTRSNIWAEMKKLCGKAKVDKEKVFPHNLRHLFARELYSSQKDIVRLADILGHSRIDTTRIYTMESGDVHRKQIDSLQLVRT